MATDYTTIRSFLETQTSKKDIEDVINRAKARIPSLKTDEDVFDNFIDYCKREIDKSIAECELKVKNFDEGTGEYKLYSNSLQHLKKEKMNLENGEISEDSVVKRFHAYTGYVKREKQDTKPSHIIRIMEKGLVLILALFLALPAFAQERKTYKDAYIHNEKSGQVEYQYIEKDGQRIFDGFFKFLPNSNRTVSSTNRKC